MKNTRTWLPALGIGLMIFSAGCATENRPPEGAVISGSDTTMSEPSGTIATPVPTTSRDTERMAKDAAERIEDMYENHGTLKPFDLDAEEEDNRVVLKGKVDTTEHKTMAEELARQNAAGLTVVSQIVVDR